MKRATATTETEGRTIKFAKREVADAARWVEWLSNNSEAVLRGRRVLAARRNGWGREALVVRAGGYLYLVRRHDDGRPMPWERAPKCGKGGGR